jgi:putative CocE/NonD family hydrolase
MKTYLSGIRHWWLALLAVLPALAQAQEPVHVIRAFRGLVDRAEHHMLPMRDGIRLWTSVYFPKGVQLPAPTVLIRTPYVFDFEAGGARQFLENGYVVVFQNERGRHWSEGEYRILVGAAEDGYDTVDWISRQPWSNRKVGTFGCSSSGDSQVPLLAQRHPAHAAAITMASGSSIGRIGDFNERGLFYRGGAVQMPWLGWYLVLGQRDFMKFPPDISDYNRDWLAEEATRNNWMNPSLEQFVGANTQSALQHLPLQDALVRHGAQRDTHFDELVRRQPGDPAWRDLRLLEEGDVIDTPTLWVFQTHDLGIGPNLAAFEYVLGKGSTQRARPHQHLLISALGHCSTGRETANTVDGDRPIGDARLQNPAVFVEWFDRWLRDVKPSKELPRAQIYLPGKNSWESFATWPAPHDQRVFYLAAGEGQTLRQSGRLLPAKQAAEGVDSYVYDPRYPTPTVGGDACCIADVGGSIVRAGSFDQGSVELRNDVLIYTSEPMTSPLDVVGFVDVELYVSSDAPDTDFTANITDVAPDGRSYILAGSIQRMRWREGYDKPRFMKPGEVYKVRIGPFYVANRFAPGHRIRIDIASSNFPRYERNLNTGGNNFDEAEGRPARNSVHYGGAYPSAIRLPVLK